MDLFDQNLSGVFDITSDADGLSFAEALRDYNVANGQVPTFYISIYGAEEL